MKKEEYIETVVLNGKMYNVGIDDYGQQYFIEYIDIHGKLVEFGCGAYNPYYLDVIDFIDSEMGEPKNV